MPTCSTVFTELCTITGARSSSAAERTASSVRSLTTLNAATPYRSVKALSRITPVGTTGTSSLPLAQHQADTQARLSARTPSSASQYGASQAGIWGAATDIAGPRQRLCGGCLNADTGTPYRIRTDDLRLERAVSLTG